VFILREAAAMSFTRVFSAAALALLATAAHADEIGPMSVTYLTGDATARPRGGSPAPLAVGSPLHEGDLIETAPDAAIELSLATGSIVRLGPKSRFELATASADGGSFSARLTFGNLWAKVQKLLGGQKFEVETQNGVAGVRGTEFRVAAYGSGQMVRVYEGVVEVKSRDGKWKHLVKPGNEIRYSKRASLGPRSFEPAKERSSFMRWVRRKGMDAGPDKRDEPREHLREKARDKLKRK
jgi:hypothetical protein